MSTHNIDFHEEISKIITYIIIKYHHIPTLFLLLCQTMLNCELTCILWLTILANASLAAALGVLGLEPLASSSAGRLSVVLGGLVTSSVTGVVLTCRGNELRCQKTCLWGFRPGPPQTRQYNNCTTEDG